VHPSSPASYGRASDDERARSSLSPTRRHAPLPPRPQNLSAMEEFARELEEIKWLKQLLREKLLRQCGEQMHSANLAALNIQRIARGRRARKVQLNITTKHTHQDGATSQVRAALPAQAAKDVKESVLESNVTSSNIRHASRVTTRSEELKVIEERLRAELEASRRAQAEWEEQREHERAELEQQRAAIELAQQSAKMPLAASVPVPSTEMTSSQVENQASSSRSCRSTEALLAIEAEPKSSPAQRSHERAMPGESPAKPVMTLAGDTINVFSESEKEFGARGVPRLELAATVARSPVSPAVSIASDFPFSPQPEQVPSARGLHDHDHKVIFPLAIPVLTTAATPSQVHGQGSADLEPIKGDSLAETNAVEILQDGTNGEEDTIVGVVTTNVGGKPQCSPGKDDNEIDEDDEGDEVTSLSSSENYEVDEDFEDNEISVQVVSETKIGEQEENKDGTKVVQPRAGRLLKQSPPQQQQAPMERRQDIETIPDATDADLLKEAEPLQDEHRYGPVSIVEQQRALLRNARQVDTRTSESEGSDEEDDNGLAGLLELAKQSRNGGIPQPDLSDDNPSASPCALNSDDQFALPRPGSQSPGQNLLIEPELDVELDERPDRTQKDRPVLDVADRKPSPRHSPAAAPFEDDDFGDLDEIEL